MIASLSGVFGGQRAGFIVVEVGGVGYEVIAVKSIIDNLPNQGDAISLVIYTDMRDTGIALYGFSDYAEREVFLLLRKVNGVGPRTALSLVSSLGTETLYRGIGTGDIAVFKRVAGVGKKTAERIIVELREYVTEFLAGGASDEAKLTGRKQTKGSTKVISELDELGRGLESSSIGSASDDAMLALIRLGFSKEKAEMAVHKAISQQKLTGALTLSTASNTAGELLRLSLANM